MIPQCCKGDRLLARCFRGGAVLGASSMVERGARLVRNMVLARILAPEHFGLMALVMATNQLFEALTEVGVRHAVVQHPDGDTKGYLNVAWWFSAARGAVLFAVAYIAAPWMAAFYAEPSLTPLLRVSFLVLLFHGLTSPGLFVLEKRLQFGRFALITQGAGIIGTALSLILALHTPSVWALVAGFVTEAALRSMGSFAATRFWPSLHFDRALTRSFFRFARGMAGLAILTFLYMRADIFVLGRLVDKQMLGYYSLAVALAAMPQMLFTKIAGPMILPILSEMQHDTFRMRHNFLTMTRLFYLFGLPTATCMVIFSRLLLSVTYGTAYSQIHVVFSFCVIYALFYLSGSLITSVFVALGRPELHRTFAALRLLLTVVTLYPAVIFFGVEGAAATKMCCLLGALAVQLLFIKRLLGVTFRQYWIAFVPGLLISLCIAPCIFALREWVNITWLQLAAIVAGCFGILFVIATFLEKKTMFSLFRAVLK